MRPQTLRMFALGLLVMFIGGQADASAADFIYPVDGGDRDKPGFRFELRTPAPSLRPESDGTTSISIPGFERAERRIGAPDMPSTTILVAIPPGVTPRLRFIPGRETVRPGLIPRPVPREHVRVPALDDLEWSAERNRGFGGALPPERVERHDVFERDPAFYGEQAVPTRIARLGEIGTLRHQRYVEVHVSPIRFDPALGGLRSLDSVTIDVEFVGWDGRTYDAPSDDLFESVYRSAFANYGQGRGFRLDAIRANEPAPEQPTTSGEPEATAFGQKIFVRENQIMRLDYNRLQNSLLVVNNLQLSTWQLNAAGEEIPMQVFDADSNDLLDPGDWIQFYAQRLDFDPKTELNTDLPGEIDLWEARDFTDENVYILTSEAGARLRIPAADATPSPPGSEPSNFTETVHVEVDSAFRPAGPEDPWAWSPSVSTNGTSFRTEDVDLVGLAGGTFPAQVRVRLLGTSEDAAIDPDHSSRVELLNDTNAVLATNEQTFDGRFHHLHEFGWTFSGGDALSDPARIRITALPVPGIDHSVILDYIEIDYERDFNAVDDALDVHWPDPTGTDTLRVDGFTSSEIYVYETTNAFPGSGVRDPVRLTNLDVVGTGPYSVRFEVSNDPGLADGTVRTFVVRAVPGIPIPDNDDYVDDTVSNLANTSNQADLLVIGPADLLDEGPASPLTQWLTSRQARGLTTRVVDFEDVRDDFNFGLYGPQAIENFLAFVMSDQPGEGWADPKPSMVLLVGDGSYDYKGGRPAGDYLPTQLMFKQDPSLGYYVSDNLMAAVVGGDQLADLVVGRFSVRTMSEADDLFQKMFDYDQIAPPGNWRRHAIFVSDRGKDPGDAIEPGEFERINEIGEDLMKTPPHTVRKLRYWSDYLVPGVPNADAVINQDILDAVNGVDGISDGAAMMQFIGHGNFDLWSDDVIFCGNEGSFFCSGDDTNSLNNGLRLPWLMVQNCLSGGFHTTGPKTMGEQWLKNPTGGALGVLSPSGLGFRFLGEAVTEEIWEDVYGPEKHRDLATPLMNNLVRLCGQGSIEGCQFYVFLGDPSAVLQIPSVEPATAPSAVGGNAQVDLNWTASLTPGATYDVYRKNSLNASYSKINGSPILGTNFLDTGVENAKTYYYYIVAIDAEGFEAPWSNFNSDCDVLGPDCLYAEPLNPNPPAPPTGVTVVDPESGGRLDVDWADNVESDFLRYTLHWGTAPGVYDESAVTGSTSEYSITGLTDGVTYYVAVTATNTSDKTSPFSDEESGVPTFVLGLKLPAFITDLTVGKSGTDDVQLTWSDVTEDLYGKPITVDRYEVYRGTTADFVPSPATLISPPTLTTPSFTDVGGSSLAGPQHYVVRAVTSGDLGGALGRQVPARIVDLRVDEVIDGGTGLPTGELRLTWSPVTADFDGAPTLIDHYEIYVADTPQGAARDQICDPLDTGCSGLTPLLDDVTTTEVVLTPLAGERFYTILAVDTKGNKSPY